MGHCVSTGQQPRRQLSPGLLEQLPPRTIATQRNCPPEQLPPGQLPPRIMRFSHHMRGIKFQFTLSRCGTFQGSLAARPWKPLCYGIIVLLRHSAAKVSRNIAVAAV